MTITLTEGDLLISSAKVDGYASVEDRGVTVVLDTTLTPELLEEGNVREIVSKVQTMRKDAGFEVTDHIRLSVSGNAVIADIVKKNAEGIASDLLADEITFDTTLAFTKEWNINGETVTLSVEKI